MAIRRSTRKFSVTRVFVLIFFLILREITATVAIIIKQVVVVCSLGTLCHLILTTKLKYLL